MGARPRSRQDALKPFLAGEGEGGAPAQSDSGGASFLGQVPLPNIAGLQITIILKAEPTLKAVKKDRCSIVCKRQSLTMLLKAGACEITQRDPSKACRFLRWRCTSL